MKPNRFLRNLFFLLLLNVAIKPFWLLGIEVSVQNAVGAEEYGNYFAILNFTLLFRVLLDLGINQFTNKSTAESKSFIEQNYLQLLIAKVGLSGIYIAIALLFSLSLQFNTTQVGLLMILLSAQIIAHFVQFNRSVLGGLHVFKKDSILSVIDRLIMIISCAIVLWFLPQISISIALFAWFQLFAHIFTLVLSFGMIAQERLQFRWQINAGTIKTILLLSLPFAFMNLLMSLSSRIDAVMLKSLLSNGELQAGIYAASFRLLDALNQFGILFGIILLPIFARLIANSKSVNDHVTVAIKFLFLPTIIVCLLGWFYGLEVLELLYQESSVIRPEILQTLLLTFPAHALIFVFGTLLTAAAKMRFINWISVIGLGLNVLLNYYLIHHYQAWGASFATLFTQWLMALALTIFAIMKFQIDWSILGINIVVSSLFGVILFYCLSFISLNWAAIFILGSLVVSLFYWRINRMNLEFIMEILRTRSENKVN